MMAVPNKKTSFQEIRRARKTIMRHMARNPPRISELLNGKISKVSAEKLAGYLSRLGVEIIVSAHKAA